MQFAGKTIILILGIALALILIGCTNPLSACGNGRLDAGENCLSCPTDVQCEENQLEDRSDALGEYRLAVILVNFKDYLEEPFTKEEIYTRIFDENNVESAAHYFKENSYGKMRLVGNKQDIFGYYTLESYKRTLDAGLGPQSPLLLKADPDIFFPTYDIVITISADPFLGGFSGSSVGKQHYTTADGPAIFGDIGLITKTEVSVNILAHEIGHTLGLHHANDLECSGSVVEDYCTSIDYGEEIGMMGTLYGISGYLPGTTKPFASYANSGLNSFNAINKEELGWLTASQILEIKQSGTYKIKPLDQTNNGVQAIKIPAAYKVSSDSSNSQEVWNSTAYYLEYRRRPQQNSGFSYPTLFNVDGLLAHLDMRNSSSQLENTVLLDFSPHSDENSSEKHDDDSADSALKVGETYTDSRYGFSIQVTEATDEEITLKIVFE